MAVLKNRFRYPALYDTYKARIEACQDEYEFAAVMASFMAKLPGVHGGVFPPTNDLLGSSTFSLYWELGYGDVRETNYAYWKQFEDRMWSYTQKSAVTSYYGGDYVFQDYDYGNGLIEEVEGGRLLRLNGEPIQTALRQLDTIHKWMYDAENDCVRVTNLIFNESIGTPYEAEIEMPDGSIIHKTLYNDAGFNYAVQYRRNLYPQHTAQASDTSADSQEGAKKSYVIETDPARKLVYVRSNGCIDGETKPFCEELTAALEEIDADTIILDIQRNGGGNYTFVTEGLCHAMFDKNVGWKNYALAPKTDITRMFFDQGLSTFMKPEEDLGDVVRYYGDYRAKGKAKKHYQIYVLISGSTFSSGDICASLFAAEDNVTLLGENTGGEGLTGDPLTYYLPESKLSFSFTPDVSEYDPDNSYVGTRPDFYCPNRWENYLLVKALADDPAVGKKYSSYEYRQRWDRPLIEALKLIDSQS